MLASAATVLLVVALAIPLALYVLQDRLIFLPQPLTEAQRSALKRRFPAVRDVVLRSPDEVALHAWHVPGPPNGPLVLYFGGNAEEVSWMIPEAAARTPGAGWLLVDYRGYGGSGGAPSERALVADALAWHDHAVKEFRPRKLFVLGRSLGSGPAVVVAAERPVAGAVLVTPFDSLVEVAKRHYPFLPVRMMLRHRFDSISRAPKIAAPLLCLAAERDEVIPSSHARKLYDAWGGDKRWVELPGAGHNSTDGIPAFWQSIRAFLQQ